MPNRFVHILRIGLTSSVIVLAFIAALLGAWASIQTKTEQSQIHAWFRAKWMILSESSWHLLPRRVVALLVNFGQRMAHFMFPHPTQPRLTSFGKMLILLDAFTAVSLGVAIGIEHPIKGLLVAIVFSIVVGLFYRDAIEWATSRRNTRLENRLTATWLLEVCAKLFAMVTLIRFAMNTRPLYSMLISFALAPSILMTSSLLFNSLGLLRLLFDGSFGEEFDSVVGEPVWVDELGKARWTIETINTYSLLAGLGIAMSFGVTFASLGIGHFLVPALPMPQTGQLLISNALFDGLTVAMTVWCLERSLYSRTFPLPLAVGADLLLAAVFALFSVFFGVLGTPQALNIKQVCRVLVAQSTDGATWQFGPLFWVMHTTFIPALLYLVAVMLCWLAKATIRPTQWFLGKGAHEDINAIGMTSRFLALLSALAAFLLYIVNLWS